MKGIIEYEIDKKSKTTIVKEGDFSSKTTKDKGMVFVRDIGILVALMKLMLVKKENIAKIVDILREDFRGRKGYSKKI